MAAGIVLTKQAVLVDQVAVEEEAQQPIIQQVVAVVLVELAQIVPVPVLDQQ